MAQNPAKHRFPWTPEDIKSLEELLEQNKTVHVIATSLGRTESAVKTKIKEIKLIKNKRDHVVIESETVITEIHEPAKPKEGLLRRFLNRSTSSTGAEAGVEDEEPTAEEEEDEAIGYSGESGPRGGSEPGGGYA